MNGIVHLRGLKNTFVSFDKISCVIVLGVNHPRCCEQMMLLTDFDDVCCSVIKCVDDKFEILMTDLRCKRPISIHYQDIEKGH